MGASRDLLMTQELQYVPGTIIPDDDYGLHKYLQIELDKISFTLNNLQDNLLSDISDIATGVEGEIPTDHNDLANRDLPDAHPMDSITGLVASQTSQDLEIAQKATVFWSVEQPSDAISQAGVFWFKDGWE